MSNNVLLNENLTMKNILLYTSLAISLATSSLAYAKEEHHHEEQHEVEKHNYQENADAKGHSDEIHEEHHSDEPENGHDEDLTTRISDAMAEQVGIVTSEASSKILNQAIVIYGNLTTGPDQLSHVRARYSGLIISVKATIGDQVKKGDLLAKIESNESLKSYRILAPITGTVIQRHANIGEVTLDEVLFSIANYDGLWAELRIYPSLQASVAQGQKVYISVNDQMISSTIKHVIPALNKPYQIARAKFTNSSKMLSPGMLVEGKIVTSQFKAKLAVEKTAIQTVGGQVGVFVKDNGEYTFAPIVSGRSDDNFIEVLSGLFANQNYVSVNSYLIKADIEKSEAEHEH